MLDVKVGDGAFMKTLDDARDARRGDARARAQRRPRGRLPAHRHGPAARAAVGNALEIREAIATLRGEGPPDFTELVLDACARLLALSDLGIDERGGPAARRARRRRRLRARRRTSRWIAAQGGDPDEDALLPARAGRRDVAAPREGFVDAARRGRRRPGRAPSRRRPAHEGRRDRPRGRRRLPGEAGRRVERGRAARRDSRTRRRGGGRAAVATCSPRTSSRDAAAAGAADRARRRQLATRRAGYAGRMPELPEVETVRRRARARARGPPLRARRDPRRASDASVRARPRSRPSSRASASPPSSAAASI